MTDIPTGQADRLFPGQLVSTYDVSSNDRIVAAVVDSDRISRLWRAWLDGRDRRSASRTRTGIIRGSRETTSYSAPPKVIDGSWFARTRAAWRERMPVPFEVDPPFGNASPDGEWLSGTTTVDTHLWLFSTSGRHAPMQFLKGAGNHARLRWSPDGRSAVLSLSTTNASAFGMGRTYVIPLADGSLLPAIPAGGFGRRRRLRRYRVK